MLLVATLPESASIYLEGLQYKGKSPLLIENVTPGKHIIRAAKDRLRAWSSVEVKAGDEAEVELELKKQTTELEVISKPAGAKLRAFRTNGSRITPSIETPALLAGNLPRRIKLEFSLEGYRDTSFTISLLENKYNSALVEMSEKSLSKKPAPVASPQKAAPAKEDMNEKRLAAAEPEEKLEKPARKEKSSKTPSDVEAKKDEKKLDLTASEDMKNKKKPELVSDKESSDRRNLLQNKRVGISLGAGSVLALAGGGLMVALAQDDYEEAREAKNFLDKSRVGGSEYEEMLEVNKEKTSSANFKSGLAGALFTIGTAGTIFGIAFYF
jgi:hypothetical protein